MSAEDIIIKLKRGVSGGAQPSGLTHGELAINTTDVRLYVGSLTGSTVAVNNRFFSGAATPAYPIEGDRWHNGSFESVYLSGYWLPTSGTTGTFNPANLLLFAAGASGTGGITFSGNVTITNTLGGSTNILNGLSVQGGITGTLLTTQQQNVTLLGTLSSLTASGLVSANAGLSASSIFVSNGATFNGNISAPNIVNSVNDITGQASITSGSNIIITQSGKQITIAAAATPAVVATSSVTGVASFRAADFDVSATGSVSLTGNVARTHIGQTFTGLQVFSSGLSANGLTGTVLTPAQPNITSVGTLTSLNSTGLITTTSGLSANNINIASGATFGGAVRIFGDLLVSGGITTTISENVLIEDNFIILNSNATVADSGGIEVYRGSGNTNRVIRWNESSSAWQFTNDGTNYLNIGAVGSLPIATASTTGVAFFPHTDFSVTSLGGVSLTGNVARTHIGQTFTGLQVFSSGLSANGFTGTLNTAAQPNITSVGTLTSLNTAGLTSTQRVNVSSGGIVVQAGGLSVTGGISATGGANFYGLVGINASGGVAQDNLMVQGNYGLYGISQHVGGTSQYFNIRSSHSSGNVVGYHRYDIWPWGSVISTWLGRAYGGSDTQNAYTSNVVDDTTGYPNQNTHTTFNVRDFGARSDAVIYIGSGSSGGNTRPSLYAEQGAVLAASGGNVGIGSISPNARLEVVQTGGNRGVLVSGGTNPQLASTDGTVTTKLQTINGNFGYMGTESNHPVALITNNTARLWVTSAGDVGVRTGSPGATFDVVGTFRASGLATLSGGLTANNLFVSQGTTFASGVAVNSGGISVTGGIAGTLVTPTQTNITAVGKLKGLDVETGATFGNKSFNDDTVVKIIRDVGSNEWMQLVAAAGGSLGNNTYFFDLVNGTAPRPLLFRRSTNTGTSYSTIMAFDGSNNVGIGTQSPGATFDVVGTFRASSNATLSGGLTTNNLFVSQGTTFASGFVVTRGGSEFGTVRLDTGNNLLYNSWNGHIFQNGSVERLRIDPASGFVGIGTNSPTQAIDVSGNAAVRGSLFVGNGVSVTGGITGTINTAAQPNITSVGVLNGLSVNNGLSVTGGINATGGATFGGNLNVQQNKIIKPNLQTYIEPNVGVSGSAGVLTCDLSMSQIFQHTLTGPITTINVLNVPTTPNTSIGFTLIIKQSPAGGYPVTFTGISGATALFPGGSSPVMTSAANKTDIVSYITYDNGSNWYGFGGEQGY